MTAGLLSVLSFCFIFTPVHSQICPVGWQYFGGSCYGFGDILVTWWDAQAICKSFDGKLAEIETAEENDFVKSIARNKQAVFTFLGGTDMFVEGAWKWASTGETISPFLDWSYGEPNNYQKNEDCLGFFKPDNYKWVDFSCGTPKNFMCEKKPAECEIVATTQTLPEVAINNLY